MSKITIAQISILIVALLAVVGLYALPRFVVDNESKPANAGMPTSSPTPSSEINGPNHQMPSSDTETDTFKAWKLSMLEKGQISDLDTIAAYYFSVDRYDSAAVYRGIIYDQKPNDQTLRDVAEAFYQAYRFSMNADRAKDLAQNARLYLEKCQKAHPNDLDIQVKIGMTHMTSDNPMKGIGMLLEVVKKDPDNELALFNLGLLSVQRGAPDKAVGRFKEVIRVNPNNRDAYVLLAQNQEAINQPEEAIKTLEALLKVKGIKEQEKSKVLEYIKTLKKK